MAKEIEIKDFDAEYDYGKQKGHTFKLGGQVFHTKSVAPPAAWLQEETGLDAAINFLRILLVPEDREVFLAMLKDIDANITPYQIDQVASWLIGETSGRPTESPASSGNGAGRTSSGSKAPSSVPVETG